MNIGIWFWIIFVIALLFFGYWSWNRRDQFSPPDLIWWILMFLVGLQVFGNPVK